MPRRGRRCSHALLLSSPPARNLCSAARRHLRGHVLVTSVDPRAKSLAAAERFRWLVDHGDDRRVLALTAAPPERSRLHRLVDDSAAFYELERRGHGVFGAAQWCQQALEECGGDKRVLSRSRLVAFLSHHRAELPLERLERRLTSPLATRRAVLDVMQLFQLLEAEGIGPAAYARNAAASDDPTQLALAEIYDSYRRLLDSHSVTTWDGAVLDALELSSEPATRSVQSDFTAAVLHGYTDVVVDDLEAMTPAMATLVARLCAHPAIESSASFTRVLLAGDECPRGALLRGTLRASHGITVEALALDNVSASRAAQEIRARATRLLDPPPSPARTTKSTTTKAEETQSPVRSTSVITCLAFDTVSTEETAVAQLIKQRLAVQPAQKIVVLAPTYADAQRLAASFVTQGIRVQDHASASLHLFDEPGVNAVYSLLVALCFPADSRHLYNVLRSTFFDLSPQLLSQLMAKEIRAHVDLFQVVEDFVASEGESLRAQASRTTSEAQSELQAAATFVDIIKRLRSECHDKSTQELVQTFLEATGRLESLLDPSTPADEQEAIALADFLREIEAAQSVVQSRHVPFVVPYLQQLRESQLRSTTGNQRRPLLGADDTSAAGEGVVVLPLTQRNVQGLDASVLFLVSMRDSKFPGRLKRLTLPLPYKLLSAPFPVQSRAEFIQQSERLAFEAMTMADTEVVLSFAAVASGAGSMGKAKEETVSRVLLPIWADEEEAAASGESSSGSLNGGRGATASTLSASSTVPSSLQSVVAYEPAHLSYSQISEYLRCPQRYFLARVMKLPTEVSSAMMYGRALHEAIACFASSLQSDDAPAHDAADTRSRATRRRSACEAAHRAFLQAWTSEDALFASREQEQQLRAHGHKALDAFCEQHADRRVLHVEQAFDVFIPEAAIALRGVWDRVDATDDGPVIHEFKTNMSDSARHVGKLANESLQLKLYMYAFHAVFGEAPRGAVLEMIGAGRGSASSSSTTRGHDSEGYVAYTPEAASDALAAIQSVAAGLRKGDFAPTPGYMECAFCPYAGSACRAPTADAARAV
ncbi:hypothetical protein PybrP1_004758 [[Pythium] brassicae (nom. inval.)]|nr:hypothetical protein PybrP1_004758 [[Pythium] brassicae (nom. inval.)]